MEFVNALKSLGVSRKHSRHNDDLFVDRLNHRYTVSIIIVFALVVTLSQYGGSPIHCWVPGHFTGNYATYAENICWVSSTYNVPLNEDLPNNESDRKVKMLKYYQWTPFILLFQALLFYLPRMIWRSLNDKSGLDIQSLVDAVYNFSTDASKYADKQKLLNYLTNLFDTYVRAIKNVDGSNLTPIRPILREDVTLNKRKISRNDEDDLKHDSDVSDFVINEIDNEDHDEPKSKARKFITSCRRFSKILCITKGKRYGNYLLALFVFVKLFYTLNSIIQLFMLNHFLGNDFLVLGIEVMSKIWNGEDWTQLERFPRVTMCDFKIREVGIVHRYTVQCVLSINLFNEKIFIFLWFWLCLVSFLNIFDLISWSYTLIINSHESYMYVKRRLNVLNSPIMNARKSEFNLEDKRLYKSFVNNYLKEDGVLALRLLSRNSQDLIVSELISSLFNMYKAEVRSNRRNNDLKDDSRS